MFSTGDGRRFIICEDLCDPERSATSSGLYFMAGTSSLVSNTLPPALKTGSQPNLVIAIANLRTTSGYVGGCVKTFYISLLSAKFLSYI